MARVAEGPREHAQSSDIPACRKSGSVSRSSARITGPMVTSQRRLPDSHMPPSRCRMWAKSCGQRTATMRPNSANSTGPMRESRGRGRAEGAILVTRSAEPGQPSRRHLGRVGAIGHYWCKLRSGPGWPLAARPDVLRMVFRIWIVPDLISDFGCRLEYRGQKWRKLRQRIVLKAVCLMKIWPARATSEESFPDAEALWTFCNVFCRY
jgi:hypothetical protein